MVGVFRVITFLKGGDSSVIFFLISLSDVFFYEGNILFEVSSEFVEEVDFYVGDGFSMLVAGELLFDDEDIVSFVLLSVKESIVIEDDGFSKKAMNRSSFG